MPFVAMIIFFVLGQGFKLWNYAWMAFLLIPMVAIIVNTSKKKVLVALSPFISSMIFSVLGFVFDLWHPGWLVYLLIPMMGILFNTKGKDLIISLSVFLAIISFILITYWVDGVWQYAWLIFLIVPILGYFYEKKTCKVLLGSLSIVAPTIAYIILLKHDVQMILALFVFIIPIIYAIINEYITISMKRSIIKNKYALSLVVVCLIAYVTISLTFGHWAYTWTMFLPLFMLEVYQEQKFKSLVVDMPFISTIIFMTLGYWLSLWSYA